jgi:molecular chaperone GrpE
MPKAKKTSTHKTNLTVTMLENQVGELTDALQRERADAMNLRRRHEADIAQLREHVTAQIVRELLPVIDNFERAQKHVPKELTNSDYVKGIAGIVKQFEQTLEKLGVERIITTGEAFDPKYHEAISTDDGEGHEVVDEEIQSGYRLGPVVLRHAMVRVKHVS